ncbi:glycosyltransferase family 2 protein [Solitalea sp. MAHUQ-68]|uniref:Glycosyltransferase family 2 protein n=1 Tax=Solitalea agri TaxID=2953739 RepID=A0A9X2F473_9SPHI|nr:glycosyltransferase family 2 protein [Solitalea agri]MCO4294479.1 glycosyltransferase family 2 protein [Solitalea agri]
MQPKVAVVILNWNGKRFLEQFLPSVIQSTYNNLEIVVGDNASSDDSVQFVQSNYQQVTILENDQNYGYAGGYNKILNRVNADYFVLLNSDVEVTPNWLEPVIELMESDDLIAVAQPKLKDHKRKAYFEYAGAAGGYLDIFGYPFCRGRIFDSIETDNGQYETVEEIFWASGAAMFIKKSYFDLAGGLDADLFAHMEEIDLCWRLKNLGYKVVYCPSSEVYHVGGGTLQAESPFKTYLNFRNNLAILCKNLPSNKVFGVLFIRFWLDLLAWFKFISDGKFKNAFSINKAHTQFLLHLSTWTKKRIPPKKQKPNTTGQWGSSIVWAYFAKKKKIFSELN